MPPMPPLPRLLLLPLLLCPPLRPAAAAGDEPSQEALDRQLWGAAREGDFAALDEALDKGADIDALVPVDPEGKARVSALMQAALEGNIPTLEYLLDQGADVDQGDAFGFTPLHGCAFRGEAAACRALLAAVGPTSPTALHYHDDGYAPIHRCCFGDGHPETLRVFLEAGVSPTLPSVEDTVGRGGRAGTTCNDVRPPSLRTTRSSGGSNRVMS